MRDLTDPMDRWWTIDQSAEHLGVARRTIERYVQAGLTVYFPKQGGYIDRDELLTEVRKRQERRRSTLGK
jgi:predicted site-specific integrase-resolvase